MVFAQNCCGNDSAQATAERVFYYFNDEWIAGAHPDMVPADSILKSEIKNDEYDNRAVFLTVSLETLAGLKAEMKKLWIHNYPRCEYPGGNEKLKEWIDANIRIPEGFKGRERVHVQFVVHPDGSISNPKIIRPGKTEAVNEEALRLVNDMPKFSVEYYTPKKYNIKNIITITFQEPER